MTLVALLALLVVWIVTSGGGGGKEHDDHSGGGAAPATSITPGPSGSGPAISEQPGGRDESGGSGSGGGDEGGDGGKNGDPGNPGGASAGAGGAAGGGAGGAGSGGAAGAVSGVTGGGTGGAGGTVGGGQQLPAGSGLPRCVPGDLTLRLAATKVAYEPGEKPVFRLTATNTSDVTCAADFGPKAVVLTVTNAEDDEVWSSKDCPKTGSLLIQVPAGSTLTRTVTWDRRKSVPGCATPPPAAVGPGTYLVEAVASGASVRLGQTSIRLEKD